MYVCAHAAGDLPTCDQFWDVCVRVEDDVYYVCLLSLTGRPAPQTQLVLPATPPPSIHEVVVLYCRHGRHPEVFAGGVWRNHTGEHRAYDTLTK